MIIKIPLLCRPKKNSQRIIRKGHRPFLIQSEQYVKFERDCLKFLISYKRHIRTPVNLKCTFYVPDKRKRDIVNLLNAIQDVLVKAGVLEDDNYNIVASVDGTRIIYEKGRCETIVEIQEVKNDN